MKRLLLLLFLAGCSAAEPPPGPLLLPDVSPSPDPEMHRVMETEFDPPVEHGDRPATLVELHGNFGQWLGQAEAEEKANAMLRAHLRDFDTAHIQYGTAKAGGMRIAFDGSYEQGYVLSASVNCKNGFGGYIGFEPYIFLFHDGTLSGVWAGK